LISIINPDESGEDNSPRFDMPLGLPPHQTLQENFKHRLSLIADNKKCDFDAPFCMKNFFWVKDVPFNAIFVENLTIFSQIAQELSRKDDTEHILHKADEVKESMRNEMLEDGIFYPLYFDSQKTRYEKIKIKTWAIFAPLFGGIVTQKEADHLVETYLLNKESFETRYAVPTVSLEEPSFDPEGFWRGPVWMATNWILAKGLRRYGYDALAEKIKKESLLLIQKDGFREQFHPFSGKGLGAHNFTWGGLILDM
ncbi:MAG TPA: trehalase family glycosidase, partial [Candidatus Saccharimonadales bacterium]|nr:trehalase family glycosidase [Candidatus Saccharimonadales bacterium]